MSPKISALTDLKSRKEIEVVEFEMFLIKRPP